MNQIRQSRSLRLLRSCAISGVIAAAVALAAQEAKRAEIPPVELMRAVVNNEVAAAQDTTAKFMFHSRKTTPKGIQNRIYVEANEAVAALTVGEDDQPLDAKQQQVETAQLNQLAASPDRLRRRQERGKQEFERTLRLLKAFPDAFSFEYAGTESGQDNLGKEGDRLLRLNFRPNPSYSPPSTVEQALQGMQGYLLIDPKARRLARIDATLFKEVSFGWGIFGRLDKGGSFRVQQAEEGDGQWVVTQMTLKLTGKVLLLKGLNLNSDEVFDNFQRMPDNLPFARAVELLQNEKERLAQNMRGFQPAQVTETRQ